MKLVGRTHDDSIAGMEWDVYEDKFGNLFRKVAGKFLYLSEDMMWSRHDDNERISRVFKKFIGELGLDK